MSTHGSIKRYYLIVRKISNNQFPSFKEIKDYLFDYGFEVSERTIQRDIEQIRFEFDIAIQYNRTRKGYYIDEEISINLNSFLRFLEIINTAELLTESLKESRETLDYISFESDGMMKGTENLKSLLTAIKNRNYISFFHENFHSEKIQEYTVRPYLLKEYQNRWYLVGIVDDSEQFRTFGIDRIYKLTINCGSFSVNNKIKPMELFKNIIGLVYSEKRAEEIILSFSPIQGKYIKSLPLHSSQKILLDNSDELRIELKIIPNYEFTQKILMLGDTVEVIKPGWLRKEIKRTIQKMIKKYK